MTKAYTPKTMEQLPECLSQLTENSRILGGGTDLVIRLHSGMVQPDALCYLGHIPELHQVERHENECSIGACCTMTALEHDPLVQQFFPALADAASDVGSLQIRNNGTIGGNVGNASPAGDLIPVLYLYDAQVEVAGPAGNRRIPITEIIQRPGRLNLNAGEAIIRFWLPIPDFSSAFVKLGSRKKVTISRIGVALGLRLEQDHVAQMKLVVGAIAPKPVVFENAAEFMLGKTINEPNVLHIAQLLSDHIAATVAVEFDRDYKVYASRGVVTDVFDKLLTRL